MKRREFIKKSAAVSAALSLSPVITSCFSRKFDYMIFGGSIVDGTGADVIRADIGIKDGIIKEISTLAAQDARYVIDAQGLVITPGFFDIHSHTSTKLLVNPHAESKITQGVTTEMYGMDGDSVAPLTTEMQSKWSTNAQERYGYEVSWRTIEEYFKVMQQNKHAVNFGTMIGQGTLRENVTGMSDRPASKEEIKQMQMLLDKAMQAGAMGISSGLEYTPGSFASTEEIIAVASAIKGSIYPYTTHMRNEGDTLLEAVEEAIQISKGAGIPLHISHLKVQGQRNWDKTDKLFAMFQKAEDEGLQLTFDRYPYVAYNTGLANLFPLWAREGGGEKFVERLQDKTQLTEMKKTTDDKIDMMGSWHNIQISGVRADEHKSYQGMRMDEIAEAMNMEPFDAAVELLVKNKNRVSMVGFGMSEENTERILSHKNCVVASDGSGLATHGILSEGSPHPRSFGTFPRAIAHYVRERKIMELPQMIKKITSQPAQIMGLKNRGEIKKGFWADLVVFNSEHIQDKATFAEPKQYSEGIDYVFVNGQPVVEKGKITDNLPGMILKS